MCAIGEFQQQKAAIFDLFIAVATFERRDSRDRSQPPAQQVQAMDARPKQIAAIFGLVSQVVESGSFCTMATMSTRRWFDGPAAV